VGVIRRPDLNRRRFLQHGAGFAAAWKLQRAAWALGFAQDAPVCNTIAAEQEVGPYYVAGELCAVMCAKANRVLPCNSSWRCWM
jgi:hypothetical protein